MNVYRDVPRIAALIALVLCCVMPLSAAATPYVLQPGDTLRTSITELPAQSVDTIIDIDGNVLIPFLGTITAAGKTLETLREEVGVRAAGQRVSLYTAAGERREFSLVGTEVIVEIVAYSPVYLTGDVARPGAIDFRPGMTVRSAIATAGGLATVPTLFEDAVNSAPGLQADYQTTALSHAAAVVRLWGIDATLARAADRDASLPLPVQVGGSVLDRLFEVERERVRLALQDNVVSRSSLEERRDYLVDRLNLLNQSLDNAQTALTLEEEDVDRIRQLAERGLAATARLSGARQSLLLVSTRVLTVQDSLAQLTLDLQETNQSLDLLEERFRAPLVAERATTLREVWTQESRLAASRRTLELNGITVAAFGIEPTPKLDLTIFRTVFGGPQTTIDASYETALRPGDVLDVNVTYDYAAIVDPAVAEVATAPLADLGATPTGTMPETPATTSTAAEPAVPPQSAAQPGAAEAEPAASAPSQPAAAEPTPTRTTPAEAPTTAALPVGEPVTAQADTLPALAGPDAAPSRAGLTVPTPVRSPR